MIEIPSGETLFEKLVRVRRGGSYRIVYALLRHSVHVYSILPSWVERDLGALH